MLQLIDKKHSQFHAFKITLSYFSTKTYVVGTQKNHLNDKVLSSTQNKAQTDE